jgi:cephalosporin hydroxylase
MRISIDTESKTLIQDVAGQSTQIALYSRESFEIISQIWLKVGWNEKYPYTFTWLGRPIIQLPEDMIRVQEVIYRVRPDVIIETGVAHGGSLIFYASLCKVIGQGRVIGVDIDIRGHNRVAIENHVLFPLITLVDGNSIAPEVVSHVKSLVKPNEKVMVILDSCHTKQHVLAELVAYQDLVTIDSYIVATDGIMRNVSDVPRGTSEWTWNNPMDAADLFVQNHPQFILEQPAWPFNESELSENVTHWPGAWLRKIR